MKHFISLLLLVCGISAISQERSNPPILGDGELNHVATGKQAIEFRNFCTSSVVPPTTINGVFITSTFSGSVSNFPSPFSSCDGSYETPANSIWLGENENFSYTLNFSQPVNNLVIIITATGSTINEEFTFTTNTGIPTITSSGSCLSTINGNTISSGLTPPDYVGGGGGIFTITGSTAFTSITITGPGGASGSLFSLCSNSVTASCNAGIEAPVLSATSLSTICPDSTVNLNNITEINPPQFEFTSLAWFTEAIPSASSQLTPTEAAAQLAGVTYYAAFFDSVNNCYSPSTPLTTSVFCNIPNGISPNNDNLNDFFDLSTLEVKYLAIFNRYGVKVFDKENYTKEWHGQTNSGKILPTATYYYLIEFKNNSALKTGWIYLTR